MRKIATSTKNLCSIVAFSIAEALEQERLNINFETPLNDNDIIETRQVATSIMSDDDYAMNVNIPYIISLSDTGPESKYNPIFAYNVIKYIVDIMKQRNIIIPTEFENVLNNPNKFLNPAIIYEENTCL